jgi:hypothetical protein
VKILLLPLLLCAAATALADPPRAVELFGTYGVMRGGGDEGSPGSASTWGGAATIPFTNRWALDVQALTSQLSDRPDYRLRRVLLSPALQYRRGSERAFWFIAAGPGLQRDRTRGEYQVYDAAGASRTISYDRVNAGLTLHWRTGAVFQPAPRLLLRTEFYWANRYVLPNVGVAVSLGIRLGR